MLYIHKGPGVPVPGVIHPSASHHDCAESEIKTETKKVNHDQSTPQKRKKKKNVNQTDKGRMSNQ